MSRIHVPFDTARRILREGDVLLFRGTGIVSSLIKRAGQGKYSHVGVASAVRDNGDKIWECVEFREWNGGRTVNLERYVEQLPNQIDVFRPKSSIKKARFENEFSHGEYEVEFDGKEVTNMMRRMTGLPYGWKRIFWIAQTKMPVLRLFYSVDDMTQDDNVSDPIEDKIYPVCSSAVAYCYSRIGYDLTHHRSDDWMEPSDVARSPLLHYFFTISP